MMPKFNTENALTWTWAISTILVIGIYLGMIFSKSKAIEGSFFEFFGALTSLGILAIGYQGLSTWKTQDRSKLKREYAQITIGYLTGILEIKRDLFIPKNAERKVSEAYHLLRVGGNEQKLQTLLTDAVRESQIKLEDVAKRISELIYSAKSSAICVSTEYYDILENINRTLRSYRVQNENQISDYIPELIGALSKGYDSSVHSFYLLYDITNTDTLSAQFQEVETLIKALLYVVDNGELENQ